MGTFSSIGHAGGLSKSVANRTLFDSQFQVSANLLGTQIDLYWEFPRQLDFPDWNGRIRVLRKADEWPQSWEDSEASIVSDEVTTEAGTRTIAQTGLPPGKILYYTLFMQRADGYWVHDKLVNRKSAYPFGRWGFQQYVFGSLPHGWQSTSDGLNQDLLDFSGIFGALFDSVKSNAEHLLTLMSFEDIHADLLPLLDTKYGWPTWGAVGAISQRKESLNAVDTYKILGTRPGYEFLMEQTSEWDATLHEGWKFVLFTNGKYGGTTVDTDDPETLANIGTVHDKTKYTNDTNGWRAVNGIVLEMTDIPGVSSDLSSEVVSRWNQLLEFAKGSYVNHGIQIAPIIEEEQSQTAIDEWSLSDDLFVHFESVMYPDEEDLGYTAPDVSLLETNNVSTVTNDVDARTFHLAIQY